MAHFEVGKKVIAIQTHPQSLFKKGDVFELLAIRKSPCGCGSIELHVGHYHKSKTSKCNVCNAVSHAGVEWFILSTRFAPYDDSLSETSIEELIYTLEEQTT